METVAKTTAARLPSPPIHNRLNTNAAMAAPLYGRCVAGRYPYDCPIPTVLPFDRCGHRVEEATSVRDWSARSDDGPQAEVLCCAAVDLAGLHQRLGEPAGQAACAAGAGVVQGDRRSLSVAGEVEAAQVERCEANNVVPQVAAVAGLAVGCFGGRAGRG